MEYQKMLSALGERNEAVFADKPWLSDYFQEAEREERHRILGEHQNESETACLEELWKNRYADRVGESKGSDYGIRAILQMDFAGKKQKNPFLKKTGKEQLLEARRNLGLDLSCEGQELLLYWELRNTIRLYLSTCYEDRVYSSTLLGLGKMKKETLEEKIVVQLKRMIQVPETFGMKEDFNIFALAVEDEYCSGGTKKQTVWEAIG